MTWNWQVAVYLWAAGVAGGGYFAAFLVDRLTGGRHKSLMRTALYLGIPLAAIGVFMLVLDLGKPLRAWHLFVRFFPGSPMSMGSWILFVWLVVGIALVVLWWAESFSPGRKLPELVEVLLSALRDLILFAGVLSWILLATSVLLVAYTGVLLSTSSRALWSASPMLPALFVVSAVSTGIAGSLLVLSATRGRAGLGELMAKLGEADTILIILEMVILVVYLVWLGLLSSPVAAEAVKVLVSGKLGLLFWLGVAVVGLILPLGLELAATRGGKGVKVPLVALSSLFVLCGGFVLRWVVLFAGQI